METGNYSDAAKKRKHSANWDLLEKNLLRSCIKEYLPIIENKNTDTNTNKIKMNIWQKITERFNELNKIHRTMAEIKQQWRTAKVDAKKKDCQYRKQLNATGGGPKPPSPDPETKEIMEMIPNEFKVDSNQYDSDGFIHQDVNIIIPASIPVASPASASEPGVMQDINNIQNLSTPSIINTAECIDVQEIILSPTQNKENIEKITITPTTKRVENLSTSSTIKYAKRRLPVEVNYYSKQRSEVLINAVEEEHKLKMAQMREAHEWARQEHLLRVKEQELEIKNLELDNLLLMEKFNKRGDN